MTVPVARHPGSTLKRAPKANPWATRAGRLAETFPLAALHPRALAAGAGARKWFIAVSGGPDSLALLLLLWAHFPARRRQMTVLHFDHRLRGRASTADAAFCQRVARALGLKSVVGRWRAARPGATEAAMREARHEFLARAMKRRDGRALWLAHHQDDVAETMLMRLARGSGTAGLAAPRPVQAAPGGRMHLRPLLPLAKAAILAGLNRAGAPWRDDATNRHAAHFRNRVRGSVVPSWIRAAGRDAVAGAALARERLEEDDAALEAWTDATKSLTRGVLDVRRLHPVPVAVRRRALHRWLLAVRADTDLSRRGFDLLLAAVARGHDTRFSLGPSHFAVLQRGRLSLQKRRPTPKARRRPPSASL